jgi:TatA/E family protein of Tat protein translocase
MLVILAIVVIVFGANKLPALGSGLGDVTPQPQEQAEEEQPKEEQA